MALEIQDAGSVVGLALGLGLEAGELLEDFVYETDMQFQALQILEGKDEEVKQLCKNLYEESKNLSHNVKSLRNLLEICKQQLAKQKAYAVKIEELESHVEHMENNRPSHCTYCPANDIVETDYILARKDNDSNLDSPNNSSLFAGSFLSPGDNGNEHGASLPTITPIHSHQPKQATRVPGMKAIPCVAYLTQEEFKSLPKYLKGRTCLTCEAINSLVDCFNSALHKKYKIVGKAVSSLRFEEKQLYFRYKSEENSVTESSSFITKDDLKSAGQRHHANTFDSMMAILRSLQRIHEIRGGGLVRYAVGPKK